VTLSVIPQAAATTSADRAGSRANDQEVSNWLLQRNLIAMHAVDSLRSESDLADAEVTNSIRKSRFQDGMSVGTT